MSGRVDPVKDLLASTRTAGRLYGVFAVGFGLLAVAFGDSLWGSRAYDTAQMVPGAPQSWGVVCSIFGLMALIPQLESRVTAAGFWLIGVWCYVFAIFFLADAIKRREAFGLSGFWLFFIFGTLSINRGRLERRLVLAREEPFDDEELW